MNFTDWHCHLLPGLDDGPTTMHESVEMARALRDIGFTTVYCTPHMITWRYAAENAMVRMTLAALRSELARQRIDLLLHPGREYYLDEFFPDYLKDPLPLGETRYLLIEVPDHTEWEMVQETMSRIMRSGYIPMIAHPERCSLFTSPGKDRWLNVLKARFTRTGSRSDASPSALLGRMGCVFQGNLGSFVDRYGSRARKAAAAFQRQALYTHFGTDLHSVRDLDMLTRIDWQEYGRGSDEE